MATRTTDIALPTVTPLDYRAIAQDEARRWNLRPELVDRLIAAESGWEHLDPRTGRVKTSRQGAMGFTQLMGPTAQEMQVDPTDPAQNIRGGVAYFAKLLQQFGGDEGLALAAYNAGPGAVRRHGGIPPYPETQAYVARILKPSTAQGPPGPTTAQAGSAQTFTLDPFGAAKKATGIGAAPPRWVGVSRMAVPGVAAAVGEAAGAGLGSRAGPWTARTGAVIGGGIGAGVGEAAQLGIETVAAPFVETLAPPTYAQAKQRLVEATGYGAAAVPVGRTIGRVVKAVAAPVRTHLDPLGRTVMRRLGDLTLPAWASEGVGTGRLIDVMHNVASRAIFGGGIMKQAIDQANLRLENQVTTAVRSVAPGRPNIITAPAAGERWQVVRAALEQHAKDIQDALYGPPRTIAEQQGLRANVDDVVTFARKELGKRGRLPPSEGEATLAEIAQWGKGPPSPTGIPGPRELPLARAMDEYKKLNLRLRSVKPGVEKGALLQIKKRLYDVITTGLADHDPALATMWTEANQVTQKAAAQFRGKYVRQFIEAQEPEDLIRSLSQPEQWSAARLAKQAAGQPAYAMLEQTVTQSPSLSAAQKTAFAADLQQLRTNVGDAWPEVQQAIWSKIIEASRDVMEPVPGMAPGIGRVNGVSLAQNIKRLRSSLPAIAPQATIQEFDELAAVLTRVQQTGGTGTVAIELMQPGAVMQVAMDKPKRKLIGLSILGIPWLAAKVMTHPMGVKWLTEGLQPNATMTETGRAAIHNLSQLVRQQAETSNVPSPVVSSSETGRPPITVRVVP